MAEQLMHEIALLIRAEVKDPRIGLVTITGVDLTPDYAYASVYFTVLPSDEETLARSLEGLQRASGFFVGKLVNGCAFTQHLNYVLSTTPQ